MKSKLRNLFSVVLLSSFAWNVNAKELVVYDKVPGRSASDHYVCKVKFANEDDSAFRNAFVLQTKCKTDEGYFDNLYGWTASWIAFESDFKGDSVVVEIAKKDGNAITKAMVRPEGDASAAKIENGKAYVTITESVNLNVDINGQMEDQYTGEGFNGKIHTITLFANPIFRVPDVNNSNVTVLQPGEDIRDLNRADWDTIIFASGTHEIGLDYKILDHECLFIPGDAIVKGTIHPLDAWGNDASQ